EESDNEEDYAMLLIETQLKEKPNRIVGYIEHVVDNYSSTEFQQHFRLSFEAFDYLLEQVGPLLNSAGNENKQTGRPLIDPRKQLLSVIWILATPDSYRSVGEKFDMAKSSLSTCFVRVINALCIIAPKIIKWPQRSEIDANIDKFKEICNIPNVIGVIDGTYIPIKAPKVDAEAYINRKCFYAITLQGICDASMKFVDCFAGYPSSVSDVRIFRNSDIYIDIMSNTKRYFPGDEFLLGDKAYPVLKWLIPPYIDRGNLNAVNRRFNETVSK
ncbi:putative nuclease HARBI1, partial [Pseudomyrmex gracilis]|uniref:putative nuclease HARBI1 n=1 Tax=Pseudomyrmex gracilis TaxID=219809 RepID=UPI000994AF2A